MVESKQSKKPIYALAIVIGFQVLVILAQMLLVKKHSTGTGDNSSNFFAFPFWLIVLIPIIAKRKKAQTEKSKNAALWIVTGLGLVVLLIMTIFLYRSLTSPQTLTPVSEKPVNIENQSSNPDQMIGDQRDEHGCLGPAGYSWNENIGACVREWELDDDQKEAARIAVDYLGREYATTIDQVEKIDCVGCFSVSVIRGTDGKDRIEVTIEGWIATGKSLTPEECLDQGGRTVNTVGGETCTVDEENIGKVTGFISPNICCVKIVE